MSISHTSRNASRGRAVGFSERDKFLDVVVEWTASVESAFADPHQIRALIGELARAKPTVSEAARALLDEIEQLARRADDEPHTYLKFIGD